MTKQDMAKAFLEAAEIAKKLPKNLQEVGCTRALDQLLGHSASRGEGVEGRPGDRKQRERSRTSRQEHANEVASTDDLIEAIDRTAHPDVGATRRVADRALKILQLVEQNHGVDGLTASAIAKILSVKFKLPAKQNSVLKALERETETVDVRGGAGKQKVFHIMAPGEAYLDGLRSGNQTDGGSKPATARVRKGKKRKNGRSSGPRATKGGAREKSHEATARPRAVKTGSARPGPKAAIGQLIQAGYFSSERTISDIQEELRHRKGHRYTIQELSPALVRSVRDESLNRERNETGQYEYRAT